MDEFGNVCLTDFGMAKIVKSGQTSESFVGTFNFVVNFLYLISVLSIWRQKLSMEKDIINVWIGGHLGF